MTDQKEPWSNELYDVMQEERAKETAQSSATTSFSTRFLTFLVVLMAAIVAIGIALILWNNQPVDDQKIGSAFYNSSQSVSKPQKSSEQSDSQAPEEPPASETSDESIDDEASQDYIVQSGDDLNAIAAANNTTPDAIAIANGYTLSDYGNSWVLYPGETIKLK